MTIFKIEVKCSNHATARLGSWSFPGRIWIRGYDNAGKRVSECTIGFVDLRNKGPKSRYYAIYRKAERWALYLTVLEAKNAKELLNDFGYACLANFDIETLKDKIKYQLDHDNDLEHWGITTEVWDKQIAYAYAAAQLQSHATTTLH